MNIQELIEARAKIWNETKAMLDSATDGNLTPEQEAQYEENSRKIDDYTKKIDRLQHVAAVEAKLSAPVNTPITNQPMSLRSKGENFRATDAYKEAALTAIRMNFRNVSDVLEEGIDENGGYLVPDEWDSRLIDVLTEQNVMRALGHTITTSGEHKINIAATKPAASWIEEGGEFKFGEATFGQKILDAHKLHVGIKITDELLYDNAFDLETYIINEFGKAIGNAEEDAFINGDGDHKPFGLFHEKEGAERRVTTSGAKISADDLLDLIYALKRPYRKNAAFLMNDSTIPALRKLKDANGQYLWQPSLQAGEPDRLLGYPLYTSQYAPEAAAGTSCVAFGDFSYYNIGDRGTRSFQELKELFAGNGMVGYLMKERVDGRLILPEAVQALTVKAG